MRRSEGSSRAGSYEQSTVRFNRTQTRANKRHLLETGLEEQVCAAAVKGGGDDGGDPVHAARARPTEPEHGDGEEDGTDHGDGQPSFRYEVCK